MTDQPVTPLRVTIDEVTRNKLGNNVYIFQRKLEEARPLVRQFLIAGTQITEHFGGDDDTVRARQVINLDTGRIKTTTYDADRKISSDKTGSENKMTHKLVRTYRTLYKAHGLLGQRGRKNPAPK